MDETTRVLRAGGVIDMLWHNFYSPSGGHRVEEEVARSPWGPCHQRRQRKRHSQRHAGFAHSLGFCLVTVRDADDLVVVETADAVLVAPRVMERTG